jgi:hypothetical protein
MKSTELKGAKMQSAGRTPTEGQRPPDLKDPFLLPSQRHPTDPNLIYTHEGTEPLDYLTRVCETVECTYRLWHGSRKKGCWQEAQPVVYRNMTREHAFTALVVALNTGDQRVNPLRCAYSNIHTRERADPDQEQQGLVQEPANGSSAPVPPAGRRNRGAGSARRKQACK